MATTIANLTAKADGSMEGVFATLRVNAPITLIPNANKSREDAPDYRIVNKRTGFEIGAGWNRISQRSGEEYLSVRIEAPEIGPANMASRATTAPIAIPAVTPFSLAPSDTRRIVSINIAVRITSSRKLCPSLPAGTVAPRVSLSGNNTRRTALAKTPPRS